MKILKYFGTHLIESCDNIVVWASPKLFLFVYSSLDLQNEVLHLVLIVEYPFALLDLLQVLPNLPRVLVPVKFFL